MNSPTSTIDDLPPEMIGELFEYLHPKDLAACSLVNKRWHSIYSNFKLHSLVATEDEDDTFRWYDTNQTVEEKCFCGLGMFYRLVETPLLSALKYLAICTWGDEFDLNKLNRFQQLVHLEMRINDFTQRKVHLNLPRMKILVFSYWNDYCALSIDCPLLSILFYDGENGEDEDANLLEVKHPETIRKLKTDMVAAKLVPFKSVECLVTEEFEAINKATLISLPRLREFSYIQDIWYLFYIKSERRIGTADRVKQILREFLDEAKKLRGSDFRFTFSGLQLTNMNVDQIDFDVQIADGEETMSNECFYMKNYHLIEPGALHFVQHVNYTRLLSGVTAEFPLCFSRKFTDIESVWATAKVPDAHHFLSFLKSLKFLNDLKLEKTELSQEFYDKLPASVLSLRRLGLEDGHCEDGVQVNFDFVGKFSRLSSLVIEPGVSFESLPSLVRWLGRLREGQFRVRWREDDFWIEKRRHLTEWKIEMVGELFLESENPEEIVNFFQELQEGSPERLVQRSTSDW